MYHEDIKISKVAGFDCDAVIQGETEAEIMS